MTQPLQPLPSQPVNLPPSTPQNLIKTVMQWLSVIFFILSFIFCITGVIFQQAIILSFFSIAFTFTSLPLGILQVNKKAFSFVSQTKSVGIHVILAVLLLLSFGTNVYLLSVFYGTHALTKGTTTDLQEIYKSAISGTPVFEDHFNHQDGLQWTESGQCSFTQGSYHVYNPYRKLPHATECFAQAKNFSANFAFQVTMTIVQGDKGGLIFGHGGKNSRKYRFAVDQNGDYDLFAPAVDFTLVSGPSPMINGLNQLNKLTVIIYDNIIYLYINDKYINQANVMSGTSVSGQIGLFSDIKQSSTSPAEVVFSDAKIWTL